MGINDFAAKPVALYGVVLLSAAIAYYILGQALIAKHGKDSILAKAIGKDKKGKLSVIAYIAAILLSFIHPFLACSAYILVAVMWLVPDKRIERLLDTR
jgi:uncharacterized membrane protein